MNGSGTKWAQKQKKNVNLYPGKKPRISFNLNDALNYKGSCLMITNILYQENYFRNTESLFLVALFQYFYS